MPNKHILFPEMTEAFDYLAALGYISPPPGNLRPPPENVFLWTKTDGSSVQLFARLPNGTDYPVTSGYPSLTGLKADTYYALTAYNGSVFWKEVKLCGKPV